ncbi:hypothetical protein DITRI_Ditri12bG0140500 [Diplodiscus trichospermus]
MDLGFLLHALIPSWNSVAVLVVFFAYLAVAGSILPGKIVRGVTLLDGSRLRYRCNGLLALLLLVGLLGVGSKMNFVPPTVISDRGLELLSATFIFSFLVMLVLYAAGSQSCDKGSSLKPHITGNLIHEWWYGIQLNPRFMGIDLKFFFVRAGMMGWLLINLSIKCSRWLFEPINDPLPVILCAFSLTSLRQLYILDYFVHEEYMTSNWVIIAERLGFMLVFGDLVWIPFTFSIQGWWLLNNKVELTTAAAVANCIVFLIGYLVFRGANKQKHVFKKNPKALIWGKPPKVIGGKLLASGYCSPIPDFYPIYLFILLVWRERRDKLAVLRNTKKYGQNTADLFHGEYFHICISNHKNAAITAGNLFVQYNHNLACIMDIA